MTKSGIKNVLFFSVVFFFVIGNCMAYMHAWKFTHFGPIEGLKKKPEALSFKEKAGVLFLGVENPRPTNRITPDTSYEQVFVHSEEILEGWLINVAKPKGMVLLFHGYSGSKSGNLSYSKAFNELGYSTLLMDFMGCGGSTGSRTTVGFKESRDVMESYKYIKKEHPELPIILFGPSMGAVAIMKSIKDYDLKADKLILECPFGTMKQTVKNRFSAMGVPSFPFAEMILFYGGLQNGFNAFSHKPVEYAKHIQIPCLLMHGEIDQRVKLHEITKIYDNFKGPKKLEIFQNCGHQNYVNYNKNHWLQLVKEFLG